jgi:hypothetical protein
MQTATTAATALTVAGHLPTYTGPLARFLQKQAEVKQAAAQATLTAMRYNITALMEDATVFTETERLVANDSVYQCACIVQLQRWFCNVYREAKRREAWLPAEFAITTAHAA